MTDRELYNHIKANYKPEKGTAIFFDLRNYHLCGLQQRVINSQEELQLSILDCSEKNFRAFISYLGDEIIYDFSYCDFFQIENITNGKLVSYQIKRVLDDEEIWALFQQMVASIEKLKKVS